MSAFLYNTNNRPLGVAIAGFASATDPEAQAKGLVYATIIMAVSFVIIMTAERLGLGRAPVSSV